VEDEEERANGHVLQQRQHRSADAGYLALLPAAEGDGAPEETLEVGSVSGAKPSTAVKWVAQQAATAEGVDEAEVKHRQTALLRDIFGNPFRPVVINPAWLTPDVVRLAHAAYDERILPSGHLDPQRLLVLADGLEDAGCSDADVLSHLRGSGVHVRGCWVVDRLTGRG